MFKSEEHKLDKLERELLDIEKFAKNLDLNPKDEDRLVLTNIVSQNGDVNKDNSSKNELLDRLNNIKTNLSNQINDIDEIIKNFDK